MFHHLSLGVGDLHAAGPFYDALLAPLGYRRVFDGDDAIGYGLIDDQDLLLLNRSEALQPPSEGFHLAFAAADSAAVDAGHAAALRAGTAPGLWCPLLRRIPDRPRWTPRGTGDHCRSRRSALGTTVARARRAQGGRVTVPRALRSGGPRRSGLPPADHRARRQFRRPCPGARHAGSPGSR